MESSALSKISPGVYRLLLAVIVVLYHITEYIYFGVASVYVFFVLSGYWITRMYLTKYKKYSNPFKVFVISRVWRLFPVYFTYLVGALLLILFGIKPVYYQKLVENIDIGYLMTNLFLVGYNLQEYKLLVSAWSLDIEIQFYLLFPLIAFFLVKNRLVTILILFSLSLLLIGNNSCLVETVITYIPFFTFGIFTYIYDWKPSDILVKGSFYLVMVIILIGYINTEFTYKIIDFFDVIIAIAAIPFTIQTVFVKSHRRDVIYGALSYHIYLSHAVVYIFYVFMLQSASNNMQRIFYLIIYLLSSVLLALFVYYTVDSFFEVRRKKWLKKKC